MLAAIAYVGWRLRETVLTIGQMQAELAALRRRVAELAPQPSAEEAPAAPVEAPVEVPVPEAAAPAPEPLPPEPEAEAPPPPPPPAERPRLEELLTVRWSIWLGAGR